MNVEYKKTPTTKVGGCRRIDELRLEVIRCHSRITSFWCGSQSSFLLPELPFCGLCFRYPVYVPLLFFQLSKSPLFPPICFVSAPTSLYIIHYFLRKINRFIMFLEIYGKWHNKNEHNRYYK